MSNTEKFPIEIILESESYQSSDLRWINICKQLYEEVAPQILEEDGAIQPKVIEEPNTRGDYLTIFTTIVATLTAPGVYKLLKLLIESHAKTQLGKKLTLSVVANGNKLDLELQGMSERKVVGVLQKVFNGKFQEQNALKETE